MARIRTIKPAFFRHRDLYLAERATGMPLRIAFAGLWTAADREGRFVWRPWELKLVCLPYDDVDFTAVLDALAEYGFIARYEIDGKVYGFIPTWKNHQYVRASEAASSIPPPPIPSESSTTAAQVQHESSTTAAQVQHESSTTAAQVQHESSTIRSNTEREVERTERKEERRIPPKPERKESGEIQNGGGGARARARAYTREGEKKQKPTPGYHSRSKPVGASPIGLSPDQPHQEPDRRKNEPAASAGRINRIPSSGVAPAPITAEAIGIADDIMRLAGIDPDHPPPSWCGAHLRVQAWLARGWQREIAMAAVRGVLSRPRNDPPGSIVYFEPAIAREHARQSRPIAEGKNENDTIESPVSAAVRRHLERGLRFGPKPTGRPRAD